MNSIKTNCDYIDFGLETDDLDCYLEKTSIINYDAEIIADKLKELISDIDSDIDKVRVIFEYVRASIPHSLDTMCELFPCSASEVIRDNVGICYSKSHLLAAMLRKIDIPTGICYLRMARSRRHSGFALHGFNAFYHREFDKWIIIDAGGESTNHGEFDLDEMKLAYSVDNAIGEKIYNKIYYKPNKAAVDFLSRNETKTQAWQDIPSNLIF